MNQYEQACEVDTSDAFSTHENVIEFLKNSKTATVTLCQGRYINRVEKYAKEHPDEVQIVHRNEDSSIVAHIPVSYIKISRPREYTEEQKAALVEQLKKARES